MIYTLYEKVHYFYVDHIIEKLTLEDMIRYTLSPDATVPVCLCLAIVSGLPQCGKTKSLEMMLQKSIETKDRKHYSPFQQFISDKVNEETLSSYNLCVLGNSPFTELTWMFSTKRYGVTMCLLSYFVRLCTLRNISCEQLEFMSSSANIEDPLLNDHVKWLFEMLQKRWKTVTNEEKKQFVLQTGICFLNIFDVGPSKAMYEFLPFLNRYCRKAIKVLCYSGHRDANKIREPLQEIDVQLQLLFPNQPRGKQMFQGTAGSQNTPAVFVANVMTDASSSLGTSIENAYTHATEYIDGLVRDGGNIIQHQHSQFNQQRETKETKHLLEELVVKSMKFYDNMPLRFMILRSALSSESPLSFWKTREELERLSQHCNFQNGDMENFLKLFSSYGSILYFHDIPSLRNYVVIDVWHFTQCLHELYYSKKETASKFGLLKQRVNEKDWEMIFELLTNLQIAAEVSPNKLVFESSHIPIDHKVYYYLPSAREMPPENSPSNESFYIHIYSPTCIPGNLQACLVQHLMIIPQCMLVPTQPVNSTTVQFIDDSCPPLQMKIVNHGDKIELQLADSTIVHSLEKQVEICKKVIEACCNALNVTTNNIQYTFSICCAEGNTFHDCNKEIDCDQCKTLRQHWIDAYKHVSICSLGHIITYGCNL